METLITSFDRSVNIFNIQIFTRQIFKRQIFRRQILFILPYKVRKILVVDLFDKFNIRTKVSGPRLLIESILWSHREISVYDLSNIIEKELSFRLESPYEDDTCLQPTTKLYMKVTVKDSV